MFVDRSQFMKVYSKKTGSSDLFVFISHCERAADLPTELLSPELLCSRLVFKAIVVLYFRKEKIPTVRCSNLGSN